MQIGRSVRRKEDLPLLLGKGRFVADIVLPGQLHMRVVRSQVASGLLGEIEVEEASSMPGVVAVWTSAEVAELPPIDFRMTRVQGLDPYRQPVLARDLVRYVGEPVAVVFAEDAYGAEDAADKVFAHIEETRPRLDPTEPGAFPVPAEVARIEKSYGDIEDAFETADCVIELNLRIGRHSGVPMETRGAIATWDRATDTIRMYGAAKVPHYNRDAIAGMLGLPSDRVHLHEGHVGGGFGIRGELYPEDVMVCHATRKLGRPVKWIEDRREHLLAANHSRDQIHKIRMAARSDGFVLGMDVEFWHDQGAYVRTHAATVGDLTASMLPGPYVLPAYRVVGHICLTNKTPAGTYRAPGRYEATFVRERALDALAGRLGLDPVSVRASNLIPASAMPFNRHVSALGTEVIYDSGRYHDLLESALESIGYPQLLADLQSRRSNGESVGLGMAFFVEKSGLGPYDQVEVAIDRAGNVEVVTGAASVGQGVETVIAQVCADTLGADMDSITVVHGQTDRIARGMGSFATRTTVMTGSATHRASTSLRRRVMSIAADLLEVATDDLVIDRGRIFVADSPSDPVLTFADVAAAVAPDGGSVARHGPGLTSTAEFTSTHMTYPYGLHIAVVSVDVATGIARAERFVVAYDVGRAINPVLVAGQLVGGVAQGIGGALFEEFRFDESGQPLAVSFMDYLLPTAAEVPPVEVLLFEEAPSGTNPLGVKGAGEGGINACGAAIAAAIDDAIGCSGLVTELPVTPERLRDLIEKSGIDGKERRG